MTQCHEEFKTQAESTAFIATGVGATVGASIAAAAGSMGSTVEGTVVAIETAFIFTLGTVVGLAAYGLSKLFTSSDKSTVVKPLISIRSDNKAESVKVSEELLSSLETFFLYANSDLGNLDPEGYDFYDDVTELDIK